MGINELTAKMLDLLSRNADIQTIINAGSEFMGNPVLFIDSNFRILTACTVMKSEEELWNRTMNVMYVQDEMILSMQQDHVIEKLQGYKGPVLSDVPGGFHGIRVPVYSSGRYRGFVGVYDYVKRPFDEDDADKMIVIAKAVAAFVQHNNFFNAIKGSTYELFLYELLEAKSYAKGVEICGRYKGLSFGEQKRLLIISRKGDSEDKSNMPFDFIKTRLETVLFKHNSVIYRNRIVAILDMDKKTEALINVVIKALHNYCDENDLIVGISKTFTETADMGTYYGQAIYALKNGLRLENADKIRLFYYDNFIMDFVTDVCLEHYPLNNFVHQKILELEEYDKEYKTSYLLSLKTYLNNFGNLMETSLQLGVHYNTIKYRMKMVQEITGLDLDDADLKMLLYVSCRFMERSQVEKRYIPPTRIQRGIDEDSAVERRRKPVISVKRNPE